jgi:hypothetical protein
VFTKQQAFSSRKTVELDAFQPVETRYSNSKQARKSSNIEHSLLADNQTTIYWTTCEYGLGRAVHDLCYLQGL